MLSSIRSSLFSSAIFERTLNHICPISHSLTLKLSPSIQIKEQGRFYLPIPQTILRNVQHVWVATYH